MNVHGISPDRICLLDPKAEKTLSPEDGNGTFDWFLFGVRALFLLHLRFPDFSCTSLVHPLVPFYLYRAFLVSILSLGPIHRSLIHWFVALFVGDDPPRDRTSELRVLGFPSRHLGPVQMTTDTALGVTKLVVQDKIPLDEIPFIVRIPTSPLARLASLIVSQLNNSFATIGLPYDSIQR